MPTYNLTRGDRAEFRVTLTVDGSTPYNLVTEDQSPRMELRRTVRDASPVHEFNVSIVAGVPDNNVVSIVLGAADSLTIPVGTYVARLLLQHNSDPQLDQVTTTDYTFVMEESATKRI